MIQAALKAVGPLIEVSGVRVESYLPESLPRLAVQLTAIRQALLNILTAAVRCVPGGRVSIKAEVLRWDVCVNICPLAGHVVSYSLSHDDLERLEMARQLVELAGGSLVVMPGQDQKQPFNVRLVLSAAEQISVLVIDDNADTLQLLQRYLTGTRYRFVGARDPDRVFALAEELSPQIIVLDVMLPRVDGWEFMGRLREHPQTRGVPVIVCTILPQEELAFALGAAGFIRKPINRKSFLSALDRQVSLLPRESC
jgi:CheY-like chemotaxis protein